MRIRSPLPTSVASKTRPTNVHKLLLGLSCFLLPSLFPILAQPVRDPSSLSVQASIAVTRSSSSEYRSYSVADHTGKCSRPVNGAPYLDFEGRRDERACSYANSGIRSLRPLLIAFRRPMHLNHGASGGVPPSSSLYCPCTLLYLRSVREQDDEICAFTISLYPSRCLVLIHLSWLSRFASIRYVMV